MDADVEPYPCWGCFTPIPPGWGWCAECEADHKQASREDTDMEDGQ